MKSRILRCSTEVWGGSGHGSRKTKRAKSSAGEGTADTDTVRSLVSKLESMWGTKTSPRDGATAGTVVDRMLGLISLEDALV